MDCRRGEVRLANFNPSSGTEPGIIRPCLIIQTDFLNEVPHPSTTVIPLTTQCIEGAAPLRMRVTARDQLQRDSDLMLDQIRTVDNRRLTGSVLTRLDPEEIALVEEFLKITLGLVTV
jgi:mRNA interferase MazF